MHSKGSNTKNLLDLSSTNNQDVSGDNNKVSQTNGVSLTQLAVVAVVFAAVAGAAVAVGTKSGRGVLKDIASTFHRS